MLAQINTNLIFQLNYWPKTLHLHPYLIVIAVK
jgi:hypothetical protein